MCVIRCGDGSFGEVNEMYLLPNTVVALMSALTFFGISLMYLGSTSRTILACGSPPTSTALTVATRPISTPL